MSVAGKLRMLQLQGDSRTGPREKQHSESQGRSGSEKRGEGRLAGVELIGRPGGRCSGPYAEEIEH